MADITTVDPTDSCAVAAALSTAYLALVAGQQELRIRFREGDVEEDVWFSQANLQTLRMEMLRQQQLCAAKTSGRSPRFCATAG
ncbi:hypothetical protein M446_4144 [Methylobacterium sp. 4-46]|uniref:hypothetical protein n=1 Tax=unclassified Methylobacterium TaxID=2615210 RepID=UPI000152DF49|nr:MULTISPECIES: hypothetical protein [Methylobacterium]ACA18501.1 hypothetical protein M446_4144 [Methylobacterium sp. 4-46]WFT77789.1 hypothetical protein QA634_21045 [Methylobacterium nodulans]